MAPNISVSKKAEVEVAQAEAPKFERVDWKKEPHLRRLYILAVVLIVASATTGYDGMLLNISQQMSQWTDYFSVAYNNDNFLGIMNNMFNIGSIASMFITPYVVDHHGRKAAIVVGCVLMVTGGFITAFSNEWKMYMGGRFVLGFGNSLAQIASPLLLTEICHPQHRGPVTAVYNCLWNFGSLVVACIGWGTANIHSEWSWRSITLIQIFPSVIQLMFIWWIPESPRYLINKDRNEEALEILIKHHAGGDRHDPIVQFEYQEIKAVISAEREAARTTRYVDFLKTKGNRWRLAIIVSLGIISQYSGNALFSNYMNAIYVGAGINNQNQKLGISAAKSLLDCIVTISAAFCVDRFGRRPLFLIATMGMVIFFVCWTISGAVYDNSGQKNVAAGDIQILFIWLFGVSYDIGFSGLLVAYTLEVLPFHLRAKGMMIMNITVQAILALSNQTNKLAWDNMPHHWNFMLFYTLWDLVELVFVYFVYVETKGPTLEEIAKIFDGEDAVAADTSIVKEIEHGIQSAEHEEDIVADAAAAEKTAV